MAPFSSPVFGIVLLALAVLALWVVKDYRDWKALGKGGVPYNFWGWLMVTGFRFEARDTLDTGVYASQIGTADDSVRLPPDLPSREGPRPQMGRHPVPHRQLDQHPTDGSARKLLDAAFDDYVAENGRYVRYAKSFYEKRNDAVTLVNLGTAHPLAAISQGEVAHIHPGDGSMHMIFSPSDSKTIIEKGWGERHPLCGAPRHNIPLGYLMIYTPRNAQEVQVVKQLLRAAVSHMCLGCGEPAPAA